MKENKGVQLLLAKWVKFPEWIKRIDNKEVKSMKIKEKQVRILKIDGAEAKFDLGSSVSLKLPNTLRFITAFYPLAILEIRDLRGNLVQRCRFLCTECLQNSGELAGYKPSQQGGIRDPIYQCSVCGHQWEIKGP